MSAGYDGRVIIWDIWEGRPVRVYETGEYNLVDGNFSPDGTSVVVSDEVGQIYLLATGQGESQQDAKYDQFFLGDFRPLVRDAHGNVLDQEMHLPPHQRNIQDLLCDANMIPYTEPYQSMYQQRRLGVLGIDWQPPSVNLAVGPVDDIVYSGIGDNPFAFNPAIGSSPGGMEQHHLDGSMRWVEQSLEVDEAMDWEQEAGRLSDDSGSDYTASEESLSDVDDEASASSMKGSTHSEEEIESRDETTEETYLRRSGRNKRKAEGMAISSFGRKMRRRQFDSQETDEESADITDKRLVRRRGLGPSVVRLASQQLSTRPKRLAAKNALQFLSHISTHDDEDEDEHISTQPDRCASTLERVPELDKSLQSIWPKGIEELDEERQNNESTEETFFEYAKLEPSELGEFSRRPRSQRRYGLNMQFNGTRLTESDSRGSGEDKVDALLNREPLIRTEGSEVLAHNPPSVDTPRMPLTRLAARHFKFLCDVQYDGFEGLSDTGDNGSDSNDIVNEIETLKALHSDEVQLLEPCKRLPTDEQRAWKCKQVPMANEARDGGRHITFPLEGRHDNLSCSSDRSASNYNGCQDAFGESVQDFLKNPVLGRIHDSEASTVAKSVGIDISKGLAEDSDFPRPRLDDKRKLRSLFYGLNPDTKARKSCAQRSKAMDSKSLKVLFCQSDVQCRKVCTERQIITRSEGSGRTHAPESHKEPPLGQIVEAQIADIPHGVADKVNYLYNQEELGDGTMSQLQKLHNGTNFKAVANNSITSKTNKRRLRGRSLLIQPSSQKLEDHESSPCLQPYDGGGGNTCLLNSFPKKPVVCTRAVSKQKIPIFEYEEDSSLVRKDIVNGLAQSKVEKRNRPDISGLSQSDSLQDNENWLKSGSDKEAENVRQNVRHKRRALGELHSHSLIGSLDSLHQNLSEDFMSKRRIRHMRSVMSEGGKGRMVKRNKERKVSLNRGNESPATSVRREFTGAELSPWSDNNDCQRRHGQAEYKDDTYEECTRNHYRGVSAELDRIQSVDPHGAEEDVSFLNERRVLRVSSRVRKDISRRDATWDKDRGRFSEPRLLSKVRGTRTRKSSAWLMLSEVEEGTRYIPQFGDEVAYLMQGHQEFLDSHKQYEPGPWMSYRNIIQAVEFCHVTELEYAILPDSGDTFCKLTLEFTNLTSKVYGNTFRLSLPELTNFPDFLVERNRYDAAIQRNWTSRDKCKVWWRSEDGKGGSWWEGRVISVKPKSPEFPDSPWERFVVQYRVDTSGPHTHSPWELFDSKGPKWGFPCIDEDMKSHLSFALGKLESSAEEPDDEFGIRRLRQVACRLDFINRVPLPLTLDIIKLRIEKNYYHSLEAFSFDVQLLVTNAEQYYGVGSDMAEKMARVAQHLLGTFSDNSTCMS